MKESFVIDAKNALDNLLKTQPGLIKEIAPNKETGQLLADFMAGFIQKYSEHLKEIHSKSRE